MSSVDPNFCRVSIKATGPQLSIYNYTDWHLHYLGLQKSVVTCQISEHCFLCSLIQEILFNYFFKLNYCLHLLITNQISSITAVLVILFQWLIADRIQNVTVQTWECIHGNAYWKVK